MSINKPTFIIIAFVLVALSFGIGFQFGRGDVPVHEVPGQEIIRQEILTEIDQKVMEKAKAGTFHFPFEQEIPRQRTFLSGQAIAPVIEADRFEVKVLNMFEGGSFTEFLFQPDYFIKEIIVDQDTIIRKTVFPVFEPEQEILDFMPEEKEITFAQLKQEIARLIQADQPLHLDIEARQAFIFGEDKLITANEIHFHEEIIEPFEEIEI